MTDGVYIIISSVILGIFILLGNILRGKYILSINNNEIGIYQMISLNEKYVVILDTRTGQYWKKPIVENSSVKMTNEPSRYA